MEKLKKKAIILNNYQLKLKAGFALMLVSLKKKEVEEE